jgi:hypothetical protein
MKTKHKVIILLWMMIGIVSFWYFVVCQIWKTKPTTYSGQVIMISYVVLYSDCLFGKIENDTTYEIMIEDIQNCDTIRSIHPVNKMQGRDSKLGSHVTFYNQ